MQYFALRVTRAIAPAAVKVLHVAAYVSHPYIRSCTQDAKNKADADEKTAQTGVQAAKRRKLLPSSKTASNVLENRDSIGGTPFPIITVDAELKYNEEFDWEKPMIFRVAPEVISGDTPLKMDVQALKAKFQNSAERAHPGRGHRGASSAAAEHAQQMFEKLILDGSRMDPEKLKDESVANDIKPAVFAIAREKEVCNQEAAHLATLRVGFEGTRELYCVPTMAMLEFVKTKSEGKTIGMRELNEALKVCTPDYMKEFLQATDMGEGLQPAFFHCTAGPQDVVYIPPAWSFSERVSRGSDFYGVRFQFLDLAHLSRLEAVNEHLLSQQKPNAVLQRAVDFLTLQS